MDVFITIGFQSFYWQKNIIYSFHLLKKEKSWSNLYFWQFKLVHLYDIYLIFLQFTVFHWTECNFCFLHGRYLIFGYGHDQCWLCVRWNPFLTQSDWLMGEGNSSLFLWWVKRTLSWNLLLYQLPEVQYGIHTVNSFLNSRKNISYVHSFSSFILKYYMYFAYHTF